MNFERAVIFNEPEPPELVHEEIHARARRADHFGEHFLRDSWQDAARPVSPPVAREQEKGAGESFFTGVEQLVDEIFLEADVSGQHVCDEAIRQRMLLVQQTNHLPFGNHANPARRHRRRGRQTKRLGRQRPFAAELARSQHRDHRFLAGLRQHR